MTRSLSKLLSDRTGITVDDVPLPSRDDLRDLYAFVKDNEKAILDVIASVSEDEQDNGLTL